MRAAITGIGYYVPPDVLDNTHFESLLGITSEWIVERTGICERRIANGKATSDLIIPAAKQCLECRGVSADEVDCIIVATMTPDYLCPSTASIVQHKLAATRAWGFDLAAACSGFNYGLITAAKLVETGAVRRVLLCGADKLSSITDYRDRKTAVLFGDAAGVALVEASEDESLGVIDHVFCFDGSGQGDTLLIPAGGSAKPTTYDSVSANEHYLKMDGKVVRNSGVEGMATITQSILDRNEVRAGEIDWYVPHQANQRMLETVANRLGFPIDKVMLNVSYFGNTSAAAIPTCLAEYHQDGRIRAGDKLVLCSIGAGFYLGAVYLRWSALSKSMARGSNAAVI